MKNFVNTFIFLFFCLFPCVVNAQSSITKESIKQSFPVINYEELPNPDTPKIADWKNVSGTKVSWATSNIRFAKSKVPDIKPASSARLQAWKGERVSTQILVWSKEEVNNLRFELSNLKNKKGYTIDKNNVSAAFVRFVMTDELNKNGKGSCGARPDHSLFDSSLVPDPIDQYLKMMTLQPMNTQSIWVKCAVPQNVPKGIYKGNIKIYGNDKLLAKLDLEVEVLNRTLPKVSDWKTHLDLWQNPFAIARYYQTPLWSDAHFKAMRPYMEMLANTGQKVITTSIIHKPWNGQTQDYFETMLTVMKKIDGTWSYDYTIFDKWVEFMMSCGIDKQINCYTMVPWALSFQYFDQATNSMKAVKGAPGDSGYAAFWKPLLTEFAKHLKEKGWFEKTAIAMDERPMKVMKKTISLIRSVVPDLKISLAGNYHAEIEPDIYDYSISLGQEFPKDVLMCRKKEGKISTYYTSCAHSRPNSFTFSVPSDAIWLYLLIAKDDVDGFLRWAYNSWPLHPLQDSRFRSWAGGDTYFVYPGDRSSVRFEKLIEGNQLLEKIWILKAEFKKKKDKKSLAKLDKILEPFTLNQITDETVTQVTENAVREINKL